MHLFSLDDYHIGAVLETQKGNLGLSDAAEENIRSVMRAARSTGASSTVSLRFWVMEAKEWMVQERRCMFVGMLHDLTSQVVGNVRC